IPRPPSPPLFPYTTLFRSDCIAVTAGEIVPDMAAVCAPVFGAGGRCEGALALTGPAFRFTPEGVQRARLAILETAGKLSFQLGRSEEHTSELQSREKLVCR